MDKLQFLLEKLSQDLHQYMEDKMNDEKHSEEWLAVDEILREELTNEAKMERGNCPQCHHLLKVEIDSLLEANYWYCPFCGWSKLAMLHRSERSE